MLFYDWTALAADTGTFTATDCCVWYQFDAGTGTAVEDYSTGGSENDGTMGGTASNATWVGGGTFVQGYFYGRFNWNWRISSSGNY